ncbi:RcnB family protein [Rosenbergiella australiborealis]|uniref:RcnB family protein n=1 Tax=Rosenbergiella australiborealis TaxID=1544696 RepID=A0ABS5T9V0_9GAMM|nr:RcnB family protein [Rosenbergiella australiborealis]MBT0728508.1 RcnB family protein [Rosenbergiella australiborealis]
MKLFANWKTLSLLSLSALMMSQSVLADGPGGGPGEGPGGGYDGGGSPQGQYRHNNSPRHFAYQGHNFDRGRPVPEDFRGPDYRVDDWHDRGLPSPPPGQHWAYIDGNYLLVAATTGIITSIILNGMHH